MGRKLHLFFAVTTAPRKALVQFGVLNFLLIPTLNGYISLPAAAQDQPGQNVQAKHEAPARMPADADPSFEVATIKPADPNDPNDGFHLKGRHIGIENQTIDRLLMFAYGVHPKQIVDAPAWAATARFDVDGVPDTEGEPSLKQMQGMM